MSTEIFLGNGLVWLLLRWAKIQFIRYSKSRISHSHDRENAEIVGVKLFGVCSCHVAGGPARVPPSVRTSRALNAPLTHTHTYTQRAIRAVESR